MTKITTPDELRGKIKKRFRNVSRFCVLANVPYHYVYNAFKKNNEMVLTRVEKLMGEITDAPLVDEVDDKLIEKIKLKLRKYDLKEWCRDNGVHHYWLQSLLRGEVRFKTQYRVKRLLDLLNL